MTRTGRFSRALAGLLPAVALAACAPKDEPHDCCAINTKAKCEGMLAAAGIKRAEVDALKVDGGACPSPALSEARIREIARAVDAPACSALFGQIDLSRINRGACRGAPDAVNDMAARP
jgi:hypothetical protein